LDSRLLYLGDGEFEVVDRAIKSADDWINSWQMDIAQIDAIKDRLISEATQKYLPKQKVYLFLRQNGIYLLNEELERLFYVLGSDERTKFNVQGVLMIKDHVSGLGGDEPFEDEVREPRPPRPMSTYDIRRRMWEIDQTPEFQQSYDLAKNRADNRQHGKNRRKKSSRMQGRMHGQKKSIEQLIQEMHKNQSNG
jgi:hypothetical protein